jgi:hypothetical protein
MGRLKTGSVSWRRKRSSRRTAAAKKVLSPISESTVMASDLVNPCRQRGEEPSATIHLHPVRSADAPRSRLQRENGREREMRDPEQRRRHGGSAGDSDLGREGGGDASVGAGRKRERGQQQAVQISTVGIGKGLDAAVSVRCGTGGRRRRCGLTGCFKSCWPRWCWVNRTVRSLAGYPTARDGRMGVGDACWSVYGGALDVGCT